MPRYLFAGSSLALAFVLCVGVSSARADTITTFQLAGTFANGSTLGGIAISMSRTANPWDNALAESFLKTLKYEGERHRNWDQGKEFNKLAA